MIRLITMPLKVISGGQMVKALKIPRNKNRMFTLKFYVLTFLLCVVSYSSEARWKAKHLAVAEEKKGS